MLLSYLKPSHLWDKTEVAMDINKDIENIENRVMCDFPVIYGIMFPTKPRCSFLTKCSEIPTKTKLCSHDFPKAESLLLMFFGHDASMH